MAAGAGAAYPVCGRNWHGFGGRTRRFLWLRWVRFVFCTWGLVGRDWVRFVYYTQQHLVGADEIALKEIAVGDDAAQLEDDGSRLVVVEEVAFGLVGHDHFGKGKSHRVDAVGFEARFGGMLRAEGVVE